MNQAQIKAETIRLYDSLPQEEEERKKHIEVRDKVIELNYQFFGYIAAHTFINNSSIDYFDKFQSALTHFCECWWWYRWEGHYRTDLSFGVFFKPRISEMIERELSTVKYSLRRSLCIKVGDQLGIHWAKVKYEDLSDPRVHLSAEDMNSLKAIFGSLYIADFADHEIYVGNIDNNEVSEWEKYISTDNYDSVVELLIHEMADQEKMLELRDLKKMSKIYDIPVEVLEANLELAKEKLYVALKTSQAKRIYDK